MLSTFTPPSAFLPLADVEIATHPAEETNFRDAVQARIHSLEGNSAKSSRTQLEACLNSIGKLLSGVDSHPVANALHRAYADIGPFGLTSILRRVLCRPLSFSAREYRYG